MGYQLTKEGFIRKNIAVAAIALTLISLSSNILNFPPQPVVQAKQSQTITEAPKKPQKKKAVKDAPKKENATRPAPVQPQHVPRRSAVVPTGTCASWIKSAGIVDAVSANALIGGESGCEPGRLNPSSYACGIAQSLPCTKLYPHATNEWINANKFSRCTAYGCKWYIPGDGQREIKWMDQYIKGRYKTWASAYAFWSAQSPHWY